MEIPDIIVVNKADHPLTGTMVREIRGVLSLAPQAGWRVPIIKTEALRGEGVAALAEKLAEHRAFVEAEGTLSERRRRNLLNEVLGIATVRLRRALESTLRDDPEVQALLDEVVARRRTRRAPPARCWRWRDRPRRGGASPTRRHEPFVQFALQTAPRALESRHAEGVPCTGLRRDPARRAVRPAAAATTNGQPATVIDGRLLTFNADGSGLRPYPGGRTRPRSPSSRSRPAATSWRSSRMASCRCSTSRPGAWLTLTSGERDVANPGWAPDWKTIALPPRAVLSTAPPPTGGPAWSLIAGGPRGRDDGDRLGAGHQRLRARRQRPVAARRGSTRRRS